MTPRLLRTTVLVTALLTIGACESKKPDLLKVYASIPLGVNANNFDITRPLFLGHRVGRFKLRMRLTVPARTATWVDGVTVSLRNAFAEQQFTACPDSAGEDGSFWTREFTGNRVDVHAYTEDMVSYGGGKPLLEILEIERHFEEETDVNFMPTYEVGSSRVNYDVALLTEREVLGIIPAGGDVHHYVLQTDYDEPVRRAIYVSPNSPEHSNHVGVMLSVSARGFNLGSDTSDWMTPRPGDSGIYHEFTIEKGSRVTYVTLKATRATSYVLDCSRIDHTFEAVGIERDQALQGSFYMDMSGFALTDEAAFEFANRKQLLDYVQADAGLERRVRETMVIASAYMLGASDGKLRFGSAILHQRILWWRNVDIQIREGFEAATTGWNGIALYQGHMNDPINAGREVLHEWAHWEFNLPNEHKGVDTTQLSHLAQAIDANSIMGARASGEFCTARNHWWGAHCGKDESNWSQIAAQYGCNVDDQQSGNVYQGRYLDVLNQLEELFDLTIDE